MPYVDGFVAFVPTENRASCLAFSKITAQDFRHCGALTIVDLWGADVPDDEQTSRPKAVQCGPDETVVFEWVV